MTWICPQCGLMNNGTQCHECGAPSPSYGRHVRILNLGRGPVFNGTVNVAIMAPEKALEGFYGEDALEEERSRPTSWEQFTDLLIKLLFWGSMCVIGTVIMVFILLLLGVAFGW